MLLPVLSVSCPLCYASAASYHCSRYQYDDCTILASLVGCYSLGLFQLWAAFFFSFGLYPMDNPMTTNTALFQPTPFDRKRQPKRSSSQVGYRTLSGRSVRCGGNQECEHGFRDTISKQLNTTHSVSAELVSFKDWLFHINR